jgi:hypothetical protein
MLIGDPAFVYIHAMMHELILGRYKVTGSYSALFSLTL